MIKRPTTLVLGAGGSAHAYYPTGIDLKRRICQNLQSAPSRLTLEQCGFGKSEIDSLAIALSECGVPSIDTFLEHRRDLMNIGKHAIAQAIIACEGHGHLFGETSLIKSMGNWYAHLFDRMRSERLEEFHDNNLCIVTFNYDRSLEYYLAVSIGHLYKVPYQDAMKVVDQLPICHVHGMVGRLSDGHGYSRKYNPDGHSNAHALTKSSEGIRIVHEDGDSEAINNARAFVQRAERILFVGFGYHESNLNKILPKSGRLRGGLATGSCYGMTEPESESVSNNYGIDVARFEGMFPLEFLRHNPPLI